MCPALLLQAGSPRIRYGKCNHRSEDTKETIRPDQRIERYIEVVRKLRESGQTVVLLGSPDEKPLCDQIEAAAKKACDAARAIYERIAAMKPTTAAGVLCQLELAASGWIAPSTMPVAMAGLRTAGRCLAHPAFPREA